MFHLLSGSFVAMSLSLSLATNLGTDINRIVEMDFNRTRQGIGDLAETTHSNEETSIKTSSSHLRYKRHVKKNLDRSSIQKQVKISNEFVPNTISDESNNITETNDFALKKENGKIFQVLTKQTILMEKLARVLETEHRAMRSKHDFNNLLAEVEKKKNSTVNDTTTTKKVILSNVMTVVDETEVRNALKHDPYVQRILKMANRKRVKYLNAAKIFYKTTKIN